jgi:SAM-dependent methyltransferase
MRDNTRASAVVQRLPGPKLTWAVQRQLAWWIIRTKGTVFDALHGVDTFAGAAEQALEISSDNRDKGIAYDPTPWNTLPQVLRLASLSAAGFTFVDVGCGKGKVLLSALRYPFARVAGVEYSSYLCQVAERNLAVARLLRRRCADVQVTCADAVEYPIPEGPVIFFFYNPFIYDVMERMLRNIVTSYFSSRRPIYLIFYGASSHLPSIANFLQRKSGADARQRVSAVLGSRTIYVFELPHP